MNDDVREHLERILEETLRISEFTQGLSLEDYQSDVKTRMAVERAFEIIGEGLNRIKKSDPEILEEIGSYRKVISFRNILAHAYEHVEDRLVWGIIQGDLAILTRDIKALL